MARGRDTGVPSLQRGAAPRSSPRRSNSTLRPYDNWDDFGLGIRHPESLVNFIAAYGTHAVGHERDDPQDQARARPA